MICRNFYLLILSATLLTKVLTFAGKFLLEMKDCSLMGHVNSGTVYLVYPICQHTLIPDVRCRFVDDKMLSVSNGVVMKVLATGA